MLLEEHLHLLQQQNAFLEVLALLEVIDDLQVELLFALPFELVASALV